ncbi:C40 family peptidase [Flavihumibacter sp. R14]|nr:C40 family peptidase [Flavihumibacter soli]
MKLWCLFFPAWLIASSCVDNKPSADAGKPDSTIHSQSNSADHQANKINTGTTQPEEVLSYARSLIGIPYKYGSIDPNEGLDCSGFITTVFNHFQINVPRSSKDFTNVEHPVSLKNSKPGDLILFTGTDSTKRQVGHMGIIIENDGRAINFIHSTSGKADGVTITPLNSYYEGRFVTAIRIFTGL